MRAAPYIKTIICLANSFKIGGSCIAGKEMLAHQYGGWIRPVSARETAEVRPDECRLTNHALPKLMDILAIPMLNAAPRRHQTENHIIDTTRHWTKVGVLPWHELAPMCDCPPSLWVNGNHTKTGGTNNCVSAEQASALRSSLLLIRPESFNVEVSLQAGVEKPIRKLWGHFDYKRCPL